MKSITTKLLLLAEAFAYASNGFLTSILILAYANSTVFADFTILGTSILGAKIFYQYSIINQFNLAKFLTLSDTYNTVYRFMVYTIYCLLIVCTLIFVFLYFITSANNFALIIFIAAEIAYIFFRAYSLKMFNYNVILFSSVLKSCLTATLLFVFIDLDSTISQVYYYLTFPSVLSVIVLFRNFNFNSSKIDFSYIKADFLNSGIFQLPTGAVSWAKSSIPLIMLSYFFGDEKLIIFRTLQLLFAPFALACSIFESFLPQRLGKNSDSNEGRRIVLDQLTKSLTFVPAAMLLYLISLLVVTAFMKIAIVSITTSNTFITKIVLVKLI